MNDDYMSRYLAGLLKECDSEMQKFNSKYCLQIFLKMLEVIYEFSKGGLENIRIENKSKIYVLEKAELFLNKWSKVSYHEEVSEMDEYSEYFLLFCNIAIFYSKIGNCFVVEYETS